MGGEGGTSWGALRGKRSEEMRCNHRLVQLGLVSLVHIVEGGGSAAIPNQNREFASKARAALQPSSSLTDLLMDTWKEMWEKWPLSM